MRTLAIAALVVWTVSQGAPDVSKIGPPIGARVPEFSLVDQQGKPQTLKSVAGKNGVMLVFFRSADW